MTDEEKTEEYVNGAVMYGLAEGRKESEKLLDKLNLQNQRLNELKNENDYLRNDFIYIIQDKTKRALLKENAELKEQLKNNPYVIQLQKEKAEMAEDFCKQIGKMKCCENCKHCGLFFDRDEEQFYPCKFFNDCLKYNKWELKE